MLANVRGYAGVYDPQFGDDDHEWNIVYRNVPEPDCVVTDNPIIGVLLGPDGDVLVEMRERAAIGFHSAM